MDASNWLFFPDYRASNPYQSLLADALAPVARATPGSVTMALEAAGPERTVFHLHWEESVYAGAPTAEPAAAMVADFLLELDVFRSLGGRLVWTLHNAAPHEDRFPESSVRFRRALAERADLIHVHGRAGEALALAWGGAPARIIRVPHPDPSPYYPATATVPEARGHFDLPAAGTVFAFLGMVRPYKGLDTLLAAFARAHRARPEARLLIAGRRGLADCAGVTHPAPGVTLASRFVGDREIQYVLRAADFVVLPYRGILTSGTAALALGFGCPLIVPDLPGLLEVVRPEATALVYRAGDDRHLSETLLRACEMGPHPMRTEAKRDGQRVTFGDLAAAMTGALTRER